MTKLSKQQKIEIYEKRKRGMTVPELCRQYGLGYTDINYMIELIDLHGFEILKDGKNNNYSKELKKEIIDEVLIDGKSITETCLKYGLTSCGMLFNWIKSFKQNGYNVVEKTRGRPTTMKRNETSVDSNDKDAVINKDTLLKQKDERIKYLEAEVAYLKKVNAVVQARTDRQFRKK